MSQDAAVPAGEVALFVSPNGEVRLDVHLERETVRLALSQMAELFERDKSASGLPARSRTTWSKAIRSTSAAFGKGSYPPDKQEEPRKRCWSRQRCSATSGRWRRARAAKINRVGRGRFATENLT